MFGNGGNSFGALAMEDDQPSAGPSSQVIDGDELDVDWLKLVRTNHEVDVRVSDKVELEGLPNECNLMVVSNNWDLLIVGSNNDVRIHRLSEFHGLLEGAAKDASPVSNPLRIISLPARPVWIRLAMNEERLVVATANGTGVHLFKFQEVLSGNTSPYYTFTTDIPQQLLDVLPNPCPNPNDQHARYVTLLANEGLVVADIEECRLSAPLSGPFTCASWSAKGKQIVVGTPSGKLAQYTPEGTAKAEIPSPPDLESYYPISIQWLENDLFFVSYAQQGGQPDDPAETYVIHRNKTEFTFTKFFDPLNTMGLASRAGLHRHFAGLKSWGNQTKHIALIVSGASSEIGVFHGHVSADKEPPKWEVLMLEETARGVLPAAKDGVRDDASVLALALDLTSDKVIQQGIVGGIELPDLPPQPRLLAYSQEGTIISFDVRYPDVGPYSGMVKPQALPDSSPTPSSMAPTPAVETPSFLTSPAAPASTAPASAAFGSSAFGSTGFGSTSPANIASTFGSSAFGQSSGSAFGSSSKPAAFGSSAFGKPSTPSSSTPAASAFGSTSKPGAFSGFGQSSTSSGFGQSALGQSAKPSAFGSPSTPSAFGSSTTISTPAKPSAFGTSATPVSAFGSSTPTAKPTAFGATSTPTSAFGKTSTSTSAFGQTAFGSPSKPAPSTPSAFGASSTPSAFGATSTPSSSSTGFAGFGSSNKPSSTSSGFGSSAFGQTAKAEEHKDTAASPFGSGGSAFGSSSAFGGGGSAFGSSSAFGQSSFGQTPKASPSAETPKPAFGGFGPKPSAQEPTASTSAFSGFDAKSDSGDKPASAFSGFVQQPSLSASTDSTKSAFAGFGAKPTQDSAFGSFGQPKPSSLAPEPAKNDEQDDFGLGGFASALNTSTKSAGVPGLDESPPGSPDLGVSLRPSGLEDETPPNSPPIKPTLPKPATTTPSSSSFIKPATAFGGAPSVGSFGQSSKPSTPAFGSGSTPAAFSTPPASSPSAFGSSAFGKPSTIGSSSPSAFGASAFGQSSSPVGFGKSATPASAKPIGNISGGFGAFGAKSEGEKKPTGFGGFASTGTSVFGGDADKDKKPSGFTGFGSSGPSVFGGASDKEKKEEKPTSAFGTSTTPTAFSFGKPSSEEKKESESKETKSIVPSSPQEEAEEVKGFDVPEPEQDSKEGSTTPTSTPVKKTTDIQSTTPESTPNKPTERSDTTTPSSEPPISPPEDKSDEPVYHVSVGAAFAQGNESEGESDEVYQGEDDEHEGEYEDEGGEEEYEDDYEDEEYGEDYDEDQEEDEGESTPPRRRRSVSIPPDMSPVKEEVSDDLASEEAEEEEDEGEYEEEASKDESETSTTRSLTKSPPTWFAKPLESEKVEPGPVSPTPGSEGASLFARLSPSPSASPVSSPKEEKKEPIISTPSPDQNKLAPSFSFKHASRTPSPLAAPPENASTTPESSPAKPPASSTLFGTQPTETAKEETAKPPAPTFGLFGNKPADQINKDDSKPATPSFSLFGNKPSEANKDLTAAPPAFGGFGNKAVETKTEESKPATGGFSLFGNKATEDVKEKTPSPAPTTGAFSFFDKKDTEIPKTAAPPTAGFSLFGNKTAEPAKTETPSSLFSAAKTVPPVSNEPAKPTFGLGLGRPGASVTPSPLATPSEDKKPLSPGTPASAATTPSQFTPAPSTKFTLPTREAVPQPPSRPDNGSKSMGAIIEKIILALGDDIDNLKATLKVNANYHQSFNASGLPEVNANNLSTHDIVAFSSISQLTSIAEDLTKELAGLRNNDNGAELKLAELQSRMVKTDMKTGQADKFLKARQDPSFAKVMQVKDLSPEQAASQMKLRKAVQVAETKIEELNASIAGLKRRAENKEHGKSDSHLPPLERVQRSVRNIDAAIRDRQQTIDELSRRVGSIRISSPSRSGSPLPSLRNTPRKSTIVTPTPKIINFEPTKEILKEVDIALNTDNSKLLGRLERMKVAKLTKLDLGKNQKKSGSGGVVMIDVLPLPGQLPSSFTKPKSPIKTENKPQNPTPVDNIPSTPSFTTGGNTSTPSPSFGGIKFNLDPGNISDLAKSSSGSVTHRGGGGSSRSHTSAAKFIPSNSPSSINGSPIAGGLFDFKKDDEEKKDQEGKSKPSGFFSFSGFGPK